MATTTFNAAEMEARRKLLMEELSVLQDQKMKAIGGLQVIDIHHPERSPGWPIYRHQAYPQMLYHPTEKDQRIEEQRLGLRRRNEANPNLAPMEIPPSEALTLKVGNAAEKEAALARGFVETPLARQMIDGNSPPEVIGRAATNPLATSDLALSVETIIKLNQMPKDELVEYALCTYGVALPEEASKVDIITAIQRGQSHVTNAA